jgi:hypothetical protein
METVRQAEFLTKLEVTPLPGRLWLVDEDFVYYSRLLGTTITVPEGFICDLNSIPRPFWIFSPPSDYPEAGTVHDFLYRYKEVPRSQADAVYREALGVLGAGKVRQFIRYWGLRIGGSSAYNKKQAA